jgi:hypothetical protein
MVRPMPDRGRLSPRGLQRGWARAGLRTAATLLSDLVRATLRRPDRGISTTADDRRARLARLGSQIAARQAAVRVRTVAAPAERRRAAVEHAALRSAEDVLDVLGDMKGAVMKVAQMASFAVDGLPEEVQRRLATLQSAAPPMAFELVADVVSAELGAPPDELFASFDREPIAAASIGQVHRAVTRGGREVAVKVQYPGVDEAILADLENADLLFSTVAGMFGGLDARAMLEEVVARFSEEFDYRREAANQRWFADRYRGHAFVKIPEVVDELSATKVLTSELVHGRRFYDVLSDAQPDKDRYGEIIYRFAFGSIYGDGMFSGDPHPGNYLFLADDRICFLDFGLVKRLTPDEHATLCGTIRADLDGDPERILAGFRAMGAVADESLTADEVWRFVADGAIPLGRDERFRFTRRAVGDELRRTFMPQGEMARIQMKLQYPASSAIFNRYTFGTWAVLGHLEAEANWHRIVRELLCGDPPSTPIGERWGPVRGDVPPPSFEPAQVVAASRRRDMVNPFTPDARANPYPVYAELRAQGRAVWVNPGVWALTRYADVEAVLRDPQRFSSDPAESDLYRVFTTVWGVDSELISAMNRFLLFSDPPTHTRLRSLVQPAFTRHAIEAWRGRIETIVNELVASARERGEMDVTADLAYPLPVTVICELMGVPAGDRDLFREWSRALVGLLGANFTPDLLSQGEQAASAFGLYLLNLIADRRRHPSEDLLGALVTAEDEGDRLTEPELVAMCLLLLIAGHETTMNLIGNGTLQLLRHPDELARLRGDPSLVRTAVEELLRFDGPVQATGRTVMADADVAGERIEAGQRVMLLIGSANHDPDAFDDPDRLDVARTDNRHVAFGAGPHFCLGAPLARLEAQAAIGALARLDGLELATGDVQYRDSFVLRGPLSLPVTFRKDSARGR